MNTYWIDLHTKNQKIIVKENASYLALFVGKDSNSLECDIEFIHENPNIESNIIIKSVLFDNSTLDIKGNLIIKKGSKNTDSYLKIEVLLMSENANARAIPSLEVMEDSVKGGHGATVGYIDPDQVHYLLSRGIPRQTAEKMIALGFVSELKNHFTTKTTPKELKESFKYLQNL